MTYMIKTKAKTSQCSLPGNKMAQNNNVRNFNFVVEATLGFFVKKSVRRGQDVSMGAITETAAHYYRREVQQRVLHNNWEEFLVSRRKKCMTGE